MGKRGPKGVSTGLLYAIACQWFFVFERLTEGVPGGVDYNLEFQKGHENGTVDFDWVFTTRSGKCAEPEIWNSLLSAHTSEEVRLCCERSPWHLNPKYGGGPGSPYPGLPALADAFLRAKAHRRYPRSNRPTSEEARKWFLAVALAAEFLEVGVGRAMNLLQSDRSLKKPEEPEWVKELRDSTKGVIELYHPDGNYYTDGQTYWRVAKQESENSREN
jgi:hypothetical protein